MTEEEREQLDEALEHWIDEGHRHGAMGWGYIAEIATEMLEKDEYSELTLRGFIKALKQKLRKDVVEYGDLLRDQVLEAVEEQG
jgi:hypothetical protein